jgi:hypothetical protein
MFEQTIIEGIALGITFIGKTAFLWVPPILAYIAWQSWLYYINRLHLSEIKWTLLEIKIPKDITKSPLAMELVIINALYQTGGVGTWYHKYWLGNLPAWFSLEMISIEGSVRFFIRTQSKFKSIIESQIYAQYPQAEVKEAEDYTLAVPPHNKNGEWSMFGTEFKLTADDSIPIKTYVDYGLDKPTPQMIGSETSNSQIDPISSTVEFFGSLREGEQIWTQILIRPSHWARYPKAGEWFKKEKWQDAGKNKIKKIQDDAKEKGNPVSKAEQDLINVIQRSITKYGFDAGIRAIYISKKESFDASRIAGLTGIYRQYSSPELNGLAPNNATSFDYPWQDFSGNRAVALKHEILESYRHRGFFYPPYSEGKKIFILNTEEIATLFHFPGRVSETPTFQRIEAKKAEPPANLPI